MLYRSSASNMSEVAKGRCAELASPSIPNLVLSWCAWFDYVKVSQLIHMQYTASWHYCLVLASALSHRCTSLVKRAVPVLCSTWDCVWDLCYRKHPHTAPQSCGYKMLCDQQFLFLCCRSAGYCTSRSAMELFLPHVRQFAHSSPGETRLLTREKYVSFHNLLPEA